MAVFNGPSSTAAKINTLHTRLSLSVLALAGRNERINSDNPVDAHRKHHYRAERNYIYMHTRHSHLAFLPVSLALPGYMCVMMPATVCGCVIVELRIARR